MDWKALFLTSTGRLGQRDFWIAWLIIFAASLIGGLIPLLGQLIALALIFPMVCITAKRLHDFGRSGWLACVPYVACAIVGAVGGLMGGAAMMANVAGRGAADLAMAGSMGLMALLGLVLFVVCLGFLLWVGLSKGDPAPNAYGAPPTGFFGPGITPTPV